MKSADKVVEELHKGTKGAEDLKSCDHSSPDCPHGAPEEGGNIPWASSESKLHQSEARNTNAADKKAKETGGNDKDGNIPYATGGNSHKI